MVDKQVLNQDFLDLLDAFSLEGVAHIIVGAHALAVYGVARATGDLDVLIKAEPGNALLVLGVFERFGASTDAHALKADVFALTAGCHVSNGTAALAD